MSVLKTYGADTTSFKPSLTYKVEDGRIQGMLDGMEAVAQAVDFLLSTERYKYSIYSSDYGAELEGLIGERKAFVHGDIRRRIEEALKEDDRITGIKKFHLSFNRENAYVDMTISTIFGDLERSLTIG